MLGHASEPAPAKPSRHLPPTVENLGLLTAFLGISESFHQKESGKKSGTVQLDGAGVVNGAACVGDPTRTVIAE